MKNLVIAAIGLLSAVYLVNPTAGVFEFIPDNLPFVGNLDEATATTLLLAALAHFGWDLSSFLGRPTARTDSNSEPPKLEK